jgi:CheY-like chemotaxis protein
MASGPEEHRTVATGPVPGRWDAPRPALPAAAVLDAETHRLLGVAEGARAPGGGFGNLDDDGALRAGAPIETWVSTRMTYCFALGALLGRDGDADRVDHGLAALLPGGALRDDEHGGWFAAVAPAAAPDPADSDAADPSGSASPREVLDPTKAAYAHAFVVLAAAAGTVAGRPAAETLLVDALAVVEEHAGAIDLIVSDVVMPEMDGPSLLGELRKRGVKARIIFVSGYAEEAFSRNLPEGEEFAFLPKPFSLKQLVEAVKTAIG